MQKSKVYIFSIVLIAIFLSCNNHSEKDKILEDFDSISRSLDEANRAILQSSESVKKELARLEKTDTASWKKITEVNKAINAFTKYNDSLSKAFVEFCGKDESGWLSMEKEADLGLSNEYFIEKGNGPAFYDQLAILSRKAQQAALTDSTRSFAETLVKVPRTIRERAMAPSATRFSNVFFKQVPPVAVLTILAKFRNDAETLRSIIFNEYSNLVSSQP